MSHQNVLCHQHWQSRVGLVDISVNVFIFVYVFVLMCVCVCVCVIVFAHRNESSFCSLSATIALARVTCPQLSHHEQKESIEIF